MGSLSTDATARHPAVGGEPGDPRRRQRAARSPACAPTAPDLRLRLRLRHRGRELRGHLRRRPGHRSDHPGQRLPRRHVRRPAARARCSTASATRTTARSIGSFPDTSPRVRWQRALAQTIAPTATNIGPDNYGWNYNGLPASTLLHWFPHLTSGSYTGQTQAAWSIAGNGNYVVIGGEFPKVNGVAQQGLVRMAVSASRRTSVDRPTARTRTGRARRPPPRRPAPLTGSRSAPHGTTTMKR